MADNPLFSDNGNTPAEADQVTVESLVGEGKRYKDLNALVKAVLDKDAFIEQIKGENAELRGLVKGEAALETFLTKIKSQTPPVDATNSGTTPSQSEANQMQPNNPNQKSLSLEDVQKLLDEQRTKDREEANLAYAAKQAQLAFGANAPAVLRAKAQELGMTEDELTAIAKTKPQAFLKLVEAKPQSANGPVPRTAVNSASTTTATGTVKNNAYYQKLRKEIGNDAFFKPAVQNEMFRNAKELGDAFYA